MTARRRRALTLSPGPWIILPYGVGWSDTQRRPPTQDHSPLRDQAGPIAQNVGVGTTGRAKVRDGDIIHVVVNCCERRLPGSIIWLVFRQSDIWLAARIKGN